MSLALSGLPGSRAACSTADPLPPVCCRAVSIPGSQLHLLPWCSQDAFSPKPPPHPPTAQCMLLRGENPASLFLFPGAQDWPPDPWPPGQRQGLASSPHQMPSGAGAGRAGGVTTLSRPPEGARCQCAWALPAMTGPPLSLAHLLTVSGLLCYSACCLGELCVCVCVFVLRVALEKKKKKTLGKPSCSGELQQPLNLQVLRWCRNCCVKGFDVGVRAILAPTIVCAPPVTLGGRLAAAPLALKQHGTLWSGATQARVAERFSSPLQDRSCGSLPSHDFNVVFQRSANVFKT